MKKALISFLSFLAVIILFSACKKTKEKTTTEKLQAKWLLTSEYDNHYYSGANHPNTYTGGPTDYIDFRADGKVYEFISGFADTVTYSVPNDNQILWDNIPYDIQMLTDEYFQLYHKDGSPMDYSENTWYLRK